MNKTLRIADDKDVSGRVIWKSPSNIAIVKYWGKHGVQLPRNPSLSLTLSEAHTITRVDYKRKEYNGKISLEFSFEGEKKPSFADKIDKYLSSLIEELPYLGQLEFKIASSNSFPHSSGIASSASAMSALALCLCSIEQELLGTLSDKTSFTEKCSHLARLGSGSASRSVLPYVGVWGESHAIEGSSDQYAVPLEGYDPVFDSFHDDILIINAGEKSVSSRAGHALMEGNPYAYARYQQANDRLNRLVDIMRAGDLEAFGKIAEDEAMTLHALMMCSDPSYVLIKPETLAAIDAIKRYRNETKHPVYFTLDAGPNIHLLYPDSIADAVGTFVEMELKKYCQEGKIIKDQVGSGPEKLEL